MFSHSRYFSTRFFILRKSLLLVFNWNPGETNFKLTGFIIILSVLSLQGLVRSSFFSVLFYAAYLVTDMRERCDSMPSRARSNTETSQSQGGSRAHMNRPHTVYTRGLSYSPPVASSPVRLVHLLLELLYTRSSEM